MNNDEVVEECIEKYKFNFSEQYHEEIKELLEKEIISFQSESSEYIRFLCGYLFCIGDVNDIDIINKAKYSINMDIGCMIDYEWVESLKNDGLELDSIPKREVLINDFVEYYANFEVEYNFDEW